MKSKIDVFSRTYDVRLKKTRIETCFDKSEELDGQVNLRDKYINIFGGLKRAEFNAVMLHEIGHAICHEYGLSKIDVNEKIYTQFMNALYDTIKRNKLHGLFT